MNMKTGVIVLLLTLIILAGAQESFAHPQYLTNLSAVYGDGSCTSCHVKASGGGPRNSYGIMFENQPDHAIDPSAALKAIGSPSAATNTPTSTPVATETPVETPAITTAAATGAPATPGFGFAASLAVGLSAWVILSRRRNK